jgi:hypothetical protein
VAQREAGTARDSCTVSAPLAGDAVVIADLLSAALVLAESLLPSSDCEWPIAQRIAR